MNEEVGPASPLTDPTFMAGFEAGYLAAAADRELRIQQLEADLADAREEASYYYRQSTGPTFRHGTRTTTKRPRRAA